MKNYRNVILTYTKRARNLADVFPYVGIRWQTYVRVTGALDVLRLLTFQKICTKSKHRNGVTFSLDMWIRLHQSMFFYCFANSNSTIQYT